MKNPYPIAELIFKSIQSELNAAEQAELNQWLYESDANQALYNKILEPQTTIDKTEVYKLFRKEKVWSDIQDRIKGRSKPSIINFTFLKYAAAMLILVSLSVAAYQLFFVSSADKVEQFASQESIIKPGSQKATLMLSDGATIELNGDNQIDILDQGHRISDNNRSLVYAQDSATGNFKANIYNELRVPIGGEYSLQLADGSKIWMNAGSSLKFPVTFTDSVRKVFLEGEAYFEVAHNGKPFIVSCESQDIRVMGTSFNVMSYKEDKITQTTLVEGKVGVSIKSAKENSKLIILAPNDQFQLQTSTNTYQVKEVETAYYTGWVHGKFAFKNENIYMVLKKLSRWYGFDFKLTNDRVARLHYTGRISKHESIENIIAMIEQTTDIQLTIQEKTIIAK